MFEFMVEIIQSWESLILACYFFFFTIDLSNYKWLIIFMYMDMEINQTILNAVLMVRDPALFPS